MYGNYRDIRERWIFLSTLQLTYMSEVCKNLCNDYTNLRINIKDAFLIGQFF